MSKQDQVLNLEPSNELRFRGPFTDVVTAELKLSNPTQKKVCFKVKTTAPKRYCVRPNSGIIEGAGAVKVAVMLQPFEYDPNEKNKHKFMVQTMFAPEGAIDSHDNLWKDLAPDQLMDSKLKCVFEMPTDIHTTEQNNLDANIGQGAQVKTTPEKMLPTKAVNIEVELRKAQEDNRRLNTQLLELQQDNSKLKDDGVRLRKIAMSETVSSTPKVTNMATVEQPSNAIPPFVYLVAAVILGLIIGKFFL